MGWHFRQPDTFPAYFKQMLLEASTNDGAPVVLYADRSQNEVAAVADKFRWFRWCARHESNRDLGLKDIVENMEIRTQIRSDGISYILYLTIQPTKVSEFVRLNPELALAINKFVNG